jgi:hypothetical protein
VSVNCHLRLELICKFLRAKSFTNLKVLRVYPDLTPDTLVGGPVNLFVSHSIIQSLEYNSSDSTTRINKTTLLDHDNENQDDEAMVMKQTRTKRDNPSLRFPTLVNFDILLNEFHDSHLVPVLHQMSSKQDVESLKASFEESLGDHDVGMKSALNLIAESVSEALRSAFSQWYEAMIPTRHTLKGRGIKKGSKIRNSLEGR